MTPLVVIPAGTTLWHGTGAETGFTMPHGPAWFSDARSVAQHFAWLRAPMGGPLFPSRILRFEVIEDLALPTVHATEVLKRSNGRAGEVFGTRVWGQFVEEMIGRGGDMDDLSDAVCTKFNGWRVVNNYQPGDDIMLCRPGRFLRRVQAGWKPGPSR